MAYSNAWSDTVPLGSADADTIDDAAQQLRADIHERMNDVVADWTADPVVPKQQKRTGLVLILPGSFIKERQTQDDVTQTDKYYQSDNSATNDEYFPIPARNDWKITKVEALFDLSGDTSVTIALYKVAFDTGTAQTTVGSVVVSAAGVGIQTVFSGNETVSDSYYQVKFTGSNAGRHLIYALRVTYDEV